MTKETDLPSAKLTLEHAYKAHHERGNSDGFLYCRGERGPYLRHWLGTGKRILDLGCRDGTLTQYYVEGNRITGADVDKNALAMAQEKYGIETIWLDLNAEFPFEKESFDAVVAGELLDHIYHTSPFLQNVFSVLKPQGLFLGSVPNSFRMRNRFKFLAGAEERVMNMLAINVIQESWYGHTLKSTKAS